jgi:hypothetical protein
MTPNEVHKLGWILNGYTEGCEINMSRIKECSVALIALADVAEAAKEMWLTPTADAACEGVAKALARLEALKP